MVNHYRTTVMSTLANIDAASVALAHTAYDLTRAIRLINGAELTAESNDDPSEQVAKAIEFLTQVREAADKALASLQAASCQVAF